MNWDEYFFSMLEMIASKSKDPTTKVGCIVVGPNNEIRTTGFNSFPRGLNDDVPERLERPEKYKWIEHAERNAIYNAARMGTGLDGCIIYITALPCVDCCRAIIQSGIKEIVIDTRGKTMSTMITEWERWKESMINSYIMCRECNVTIRFLTDEETPNEEFERLMEIE
jgi:dCMP deaminase